MHACTVILTSSPIPSCPSTELLEQVLQSIPLALAESKLIVTFDCVGSIASSSRLKKGRVSADIANNYPEYVRRVKMLFGPCGIRQRYSSSWISMPTDSPHSSRVVFLEPSSRIGFGWCVRLALTLVRTPIVLVLQHDWIFSSPVPQMANLIHSMVQCAEVKYLTFITRGTQFYSSTVGNSHAAFRSVLKRFASDPKFDHLKQGQVLPCFHFFDRPHLCKTERYRQLLASGLCKKGQFIEDTIGTAYLSSIQQAESADAAFEAWLCNGCYIFHPDGGSNIVLSHLHGRLVLEERSQAERIRNYRDQDEAQR